MRFFHILSHITRCGQVGAGLDSRGVTLYHYRRMAKIYSRCALFALAAALFTAMSAGAEPTVTIDGVEYVCEDGVCKPREDAPADALPAAPDAEESVRYLEGYVNSDRFIAFLDGDEHSAFARLFRADTSILLLVLLAFLGGVAMNLTPCVLPMIPVNLIIIGKSAHRGLVYGLGMTLAYGALGLAASFGSLAFGTIQSNPWFNMAIALVFLALAAALAGVFSIDFSKSRKPRMPGEKTMPLVYVFFAGTLAAVLAGACVAPVLVAVLVLTADLFAKGTAAALVLPFAVGAGMAAPWPFAGAGMKVLPRPGAWMKWVNRLFALAVTLFAAWYMHLAIEGFSSSAGTPQEAEAGEIAMTSETFSLEGLKRPVLVDCWATWCKNCTAMDKVLAQEHVKRKLENFTVIRLQAENFPKLRALPLFRNIKGLPAFAIIGDTEKATTNEEEKKK